MTTEPTFNCMMGLRLNLFTVPFLNPAYNAVGATLLCSLLRARLSLAGITNLTCSQGDLNTARICIASDDLQAVRSVIEQALPEVCIPLEQVELSYYDLREGMWRNLTTGDALEGMQNFLAEMSKDVQWDNEKYPALFAAFKSSLGLK
jgi:hypothetical protein